MDPDTSPPDSDLPGAFNYILSFLLVGLAWGFTTPFMRRAAVDFNARNEQQRQQEPSDTDGPKPGAAAGGVMVWLREKIRSVFWTVVNLLCTPAYLIPLALNLSGSVWFFLLVGKHELSLTVPITNSMAFLFTVLGEWYVESKVIEKETWLGMALVLGGIALCVSSKSS